MTNKISVKSKWLLFDWGDTLMRNNLAAVGPMVAWPEVEIVPGAFEILTRLKTDWGLALATNAAESNEEQIWAALKRVDLDKFIEKIYCFRKIGFKKPMPEFFGYIVQDLGTTVDQVVMIGDSFEIDVLGANRAGLRAIWLNERSPEQRSGELYRTIGSLKNLPLALEEYIH